MALRHMLLLAALLLMLLGVCRCVFGAEECRCCGEAAPTCSDVLEPSA